MNYGCIQSGQQSTNSENVDMSYSSVILTVTMEMISPTLKAAINNLWPLEGRISPKQADRHTALKYTSSHWRFLAISLSNEKQSMCSDVDTPIGLAVIRLHLSTCYKSLLKTNVIIFIMSRNKL